MSPVRAYLSLPMSEIVQGITGLGARNLSRIDYFIRSDILPGFPSPPLFPVNISPVIAARVSGTRVIFVARTLYPDIVGHTARIVEMMSTFGGTLMDPPPKICVSSAWTGAVMVMARMVMMSVASLLIISPLLFISVLAFLVIVQAGTPCRRPRRGSGCLRHPRPRRGKIWRGKRDHNPSPPVVS